MISRRTVLKYGLGGAAILAAGGAGLALQPTRMRSPSGPLQALTPREYSILWALAERISPGGGRFPRASDVDVAGKADAYLATIHPASKDEVRQALRLLENALASLVFDGRPRTFTGSPPEVQDAILENWRTSRIPVRRTAFLALHNLCAASFYASPAVYPAVGYPGPPDYGNVARAR